MLSEIQQKKINHLFNVLDANKNGTLQLDDFVQVSEDILQQLSIDRHSRSGQLILIRANRLFVQLLIDTQQPELSISLWDWMKFFDKEISSSPGETRALDSYIFRTTFHLFSLFDLNNDNQISVEEYSNMWSIYKIPKESCEESFDLLDKNGDLLISADEMVSGLNDFFNSSDPNAPGNLIFGKWDY